MQNNQFLSIRQLIVADLKKAIISSGYPSSDVDCYIPENLSFGDYTSNIALQLTNQNSVISKHSSIEIAKKIIEKIGHPDYLEKINFAGPGFINFTITDQLLFKNLLEPAEVLSLNPKQKVMIEFAHPNTHKAFHIGHLRNIILGESLCRLLEGVGMDVFRANYQGDIGPHVAKALWGLQNLQKDGLKIEKDGDTKLKAELLGKAYAIGSKNYQEDPEIKQDIDQLNQLLYKRDPSIWDLWMETRTWSLDYFESIYHYLGTRFDRLFFESEVDRTGKEIVLSHLEDGIFEESEGAVIFNGEKFGLHKRVFITQQGNPTYEAKDIGLAQAEYEAFAFDKLIHVVANEQEGYFNVIIKALEQVFPQIGPREYHLSYGMVKLPTGKMSSRTGEVITGDDLLSNVREKVAEVMKDSKLTLKDEVIEKVAVGAAKFAMLKYSPSSDMVFDLNNSVSLLGDSGPYLQYTYARIKSVMKNAQLEIADLEELPKYLRMEKEERELLVRLDYFDMIVNHAALEYRPNILAQYILELAKAFNLFYQKYRIINSDQQQFRLMLTTAVGKTIFKGLYLLGIEAPEAM